MKIKTTFFTLLTLLSTTYIAGCDGTGPFANYSNYDLKNEYAKCNSESLSPGGAQRCGNIEKECKLRREKSGFRC